MGTALMAKNKNRRSEASMAIAKAILEQYHPRNVKEAQDAIKDIFGPTSPHLKATR